jgi:hypothetical protein
LVVCLALEAVLIGGIGLGLVGSSGRVAVGSVDRVGALALDLDLALNHLENLLLSLLPVHLLDLFAHFSDRAGLFRGRSRG